MQQLVQAIAQLHLQHAAIRRHCMIHCVAPIALCSENLVGQCGIPNVTAQVVAKPTIIPGSNRFIQVSVGGKHNCAVDVESELWCWG